MKKKLISSNHAVKIEKQRNLILNQFMNNCENQKFCQNHMTYGGKVNELWHLTRKTKGGKPFYECDITKKNLESS